MIVAKSITTGVDEYFFCCGFYKVYLIYSFERFLIFLEVKRLTGKEMSNQVLQYLREACMLSFDNVKDSLMITLLTCLGVIRGCSKNF